MTGGYSATLEQQLLFAAVRGCITDVKEAVSDGADINYQGPITGLTTLHISTYNGFSEIVEYLIDQGADLNLADDNLGQFTALHYSLHLQSATNETENNLEDWFMRKAAYIICYATLLKIIWDENWSENYGWMEMIWCENGLGRKRS